jgi:DNA-binding HxlR family transcriptional regulator
MWRSMAQRIRRAGRETSAKIGLLRRAPGVITSIMHRYGQYCPVARAAEILADRWTVLIVRELLADVNHFNELERGLPHMSRTLLAERLRRLQQAGVLERRGASRGKRTEYRLTPAGRELQPIIDQFGGWGARWAFGEPRRSELDPVILLWWMRRRVRFEAIGRRRAVIQFDFRGGPRRSYWLLIDRTDVSVCLKHPGFDIDVTVSADIVAFYRVWLGRATLSEALRRQQIRLDGTSADVRAFPDWFAWSPMADAVRAALTAPVAQGQVRPWETTAPQHARERSQSRLRE